LARGRVPIRIKFGSGFAGLGYRLHRGLGLS
jgi:hypothetical protein